MSTDLFPRSAKLPGHSPMFWVKNKDRYLRQLLIEDIEEHTKRRLIVYYTDCDGTTAQIDQGDDIHLHEALNDAKGEPIDLLLETNGGFTDATDKLASLLRACAPDLRVIIPRRAKSNGTLLSFCGQTILMGDCSEIGPIDPSFGGISADFLLRTSETHPGSVEPLMLITAREGINHSKRIAKTLLGSGMLKGHDPKKVDDIVEKLASRETYNSHGACIDADEAIQLNLHVTKCAPGDEIWKRVWLLRCMYEYDCRVSGYGKIFEGRRTSSPILAPRA